MKDLLLAIDQGTTGTTAMVIDRHLNVLAKINHEFPQYFPKPGWVEHDAQEIWASTIKSIRDVIELAKVDVQRIAALGITNQRETVVLWDRCTGTPVYRAIVWQDRRTADTCLRLKRRGIEPAIRRVTGLVLDPYFSATKIAWLLDHVKQARRRAERGELAVGTIDSFLLWKLTGGAVHATDVSNASRTLLMNLATLQWDPQLLKRFHVPSNILPEIRSSSEVYGATHGVPGLPDGIPIAGIAGDQQAALFGQACFHAGEAKCTYGTGSFLLMNTGKKRVCSRSGMLTTVAWKIGNEVTYALEGSAFIAGAAVQWLRDGLHLIEKSSDIEALASSVPDTGGVTFVPAFVGLGSPHWKPNARGLVSGITRGTTAAHLARAVLEGIAFLQYDILMAMQRDLRKRLKSLKVDGGAAADNLLMQFQSDLLGVRLVRPRVVETTVLGVACLAGLAVGLWKNKQELAKHWKHDRTFQPHMSKKAVAEHVRRWQNALHFYGNS